MRLHARSYARHDQGHRPGAVYGKAAAPYLHARRAPESKEGEPIRYTLVIKKRDDLPEG
jgi:hypothetical protein